MKWFIAKLIFHIINDEINSSKQFDEQVRLISAADKAIALNKAQHIGEDEEELFWNSREQLVQWKFINVAELYELGELIDGMELHSKVQEYDEPLSYISSVHKRATDIEQCGVRKNLQLL
jgi:hypothetical protein